jgi:hypothetical protein
VDGVNVADLLCGSDMSMSYSYSRGNSTSHFSHSYKSGDDDDDYINDDGNDDTEYSLSYGGGGSDDDDDTVVVDDDFIGDDGDNNSMSFSHSYGGGGSDDDDTVVVDDDFIDDAGDNNSMSFSHSYSGGGSDDDDDDSVVGDDVNEDDDSTPTQSPSATPTESPSQQPTSSPTHAPTQYPTSSPTASPTLTPQPGVEVVYSSPMLLSENGANTSYFTIALTTEPLSTVVVSFSSRSGYVSFDPSSISFDYTNYKDATIVIVTANDDDIDLGTSFGDVIVSSFSSEDSWFECDEALRTNCGQAVKYNNMTIESMNVTIVDDDTAGFTFSTDFVNATYNNFGDALTEASYSIVLNSEPIDTVTISLSGLGSYCTADDSSVSFEPEDWDTPVFVSISCTAATSDRPVCASGNRFCDALNGRKEVVSHDCASNDDLYNSISTFLPDVDIAVEVVHDSTDPPRVTVARFGNLLSSITITLNRESDRAGNSGSFACSTLLDLTATQVKKYFGTGATCSFTSTTALKITFGTSATVLPDVDEFGFKDLKLKTSISGASLYTMNETFTIKQPLTPTVPKISLAVSSTYVGICDDLTVYASTSSGSGGRTMTYNFSVVPGNSISSVYNVSEVLQVLNEQNGGNGKNRVTIPSATMQKGSTMNFRLTATNFLGEVGQATISAKKLGFPAPVVAIQGSSSFTTTRSDAFTLQASGVTNK